MLHRSLALCLGALSAAALFSAAAAQARADAAVSVGADPATTLTLNVNDTITIPIYATVTGSTSGIFSYDFDVLNSPSLSILSFQLDGDTSLGNSSFTSIDSSGAHNLNAGFDADGAGVGTRVELFKVTVKALSAGPGSLSIGDSVIPQGAPIVLYDDTEPPVDSAQVQIQVNAVPEPASLTLLAASLPLLMRCRQRR